MAATDELVVPTADDYDRAYKDRNTQNAQQLSNTIYNAATVNPDQAAKQLSIAQNLNIPPSSVAAHPDDTARQDKVKRLDAFNVVESHPQTAEFLTDQNNANISHDDIPNLAKIDSITNWLGQNPDETFREKLSNWWRGLYGAPTVEQERQQRSSADAAMILSARQPGMTDDQAWEAARAGVSDHLRPAEIGLQRAVDSGSFGLIAPTNELQSHDWQESVGAGAGQLAGFIAGPGMVSHALINPLEHVAGESFAKAFTKDVANQAGTLALASALEKGGHAALDTTSPDQAIQIEANALKGGAEMGAMFGAAGRFAPDNTMQQWLLRAVGVSAAQDATDGTNPLDDRPLEDKVFSYLMNVAFTKNGAGRTDGGWLKDATNAEVSKAENDRVMQLMQTANASKVRERAPDMFNKFVKSVTDDTSLQDVYVNGEIFKQEMDKAGVRMDTLQREMPDVATQMNEALQTQGDVRIPTADYATHVGNEQSPVGNVFAELLPHLKTDPAGMTYAEGENFNQHSGEILQAEAEAHDKEMQAGALKQATKKVVYDDMLNQLNATGRYHPDAAKTQAKVYTEMADKMSSSLDMPIEDFHRHFGQNIAGEGKGSFDQELSDVYREERSRHIGREVMRMVNNLGDDAFAYKDLKADKDLGKSIESSALSPEDKATVEPLAKDEKGSRNAADEQYTVTTPDGKKGYVYRFGKDVQIDVSGLHSGTSRGSAVYQGVAAWAHANGYVFEGDSAGITLPGIIRRTENMISSIAHLGTSDHLRLHPDQKNPERHDSAAQLGVSGIRWKSGDTEHNVGELLSFSYNVVRALNKDIDQIKATESGTLEEPTLDFTSNEGDVLTSARMKEIVDDVERAYEQFRDPSQKDRISPIGASTIARAAVTGTLARQFGNGEGADVRNAVGDQALFKRFYQSTDGTRGFFDPENRTVGLLKDADLSTYIHETGHWALDIYSKIASLPDAPEAIKEDMGKLLSWFGVDSLDKWNAMSVDEQRPYHEQLARGFEQYFMEGKAPSVELQPIFARIKSWMIHIYQSLSNLGVELTPEVRGVFDRMLASDDAIREAEATRGYFDALKTRPAGASDADWLAYQHLGNEATQEAIDSMQARSLRDMKWLSNARSKLMRNLQNSADEQRREVRIDARRDVLSTPLYQAWGFLTRKDPAAYQRYLESSGRVLDSSFDSLGEAIKKLGGLDRAAVKAEWGTSHEDIPKGIVKKSGGRSIDEMAELLGERGYLPKDEHGKVDLHDFEDKFASELSGDKQYSNHAEYDRIFPQEPHPEELKKFPAGKIDEDQLRAMVNEVGQPAIDRLEKLGMTGKDGIDPEVLAEMFKGFETGADLVQQLAGAEVPQKAIEGLTDRYMLERHGEMATPRAISDAANALIHNEARAKFIATNLKALVKSPISVRQLMKGAKEAAEAAISAKKIRDVKVNQYEAAEGKAHKAVLKLAGNDLAGAIKAQRSALLNNQLVKSAQAAMTDVEKGITYFKRFDKKSITDKMDVDVRDQVFDLLERFDFRKVPTTGPTRAEINLDNWIKSQVDAGYAPVVDAQLLNPQFKMQYRDMKVSEFRGLVDAVKAIEHLGRERKIITIDGERIELAQMVEELNNKMIARGEKFTDAQLAEQPRRGVDPLWNVAMDRISAMLRAVATELKVPHFKANRYDTHEILGPFHRAIFEPVFQANYDYLDMTREVSNIFRDKVKNELGNDWQKTLKEVVTNHALMDNSLETPTKRRLTRGDMLSIALHVGNESNFDKLTNGMGWHPNDVWGMLHTNMTAKDWSAVKTMGEVAGMHWDQMDAMNRRLGNTSPEKIEPRPFMTKFGEMPGWYAPIKYDPIRSKLGIKKADATSVNPSDGLFNKGYYRADTTTNGSLNARASGYHDFIDLNWHSLEGAISDTIRDLAYRERMIDSHKIYEDKNFRKQFLRTYGREEYKSLGDWMGRLVNSEVGEEKQSKLTAILAASRRAMVANGIALRLSTMEKHGSSAAFKSMGYFAGGGEKYLLGRAKSMMTNHGKEVVEALAKFPEIRARAQQQDRDFAASVASLVEAEHLHSKAERFGHAGVAYLDFFTAVPTAHAAYDWATTEGIPERLGGTGKPMSHADAVKWASSVVREAHGTSIESDRSNLISNKSEVVKGLTILHNFMNNSLGQQTDTLDKALHANHFGKPELLARMMFSQVAPAILAGYITFGPKVDDEPWWKWTAGALAGEFAGGFPMLREAYSAVVEGHDSAGLPPWIKAVTDIATVPKDIIKGDAKHPIKDVGNAAGLFLPGLGQAGATSQFLYDEKTGAQSATTVGEWIRGLQSGKAAPPQR